MSDTSQGEGWWIASDGKWYAPEHHPDYVAPSLPTPPIVPETPNYAAETIAVPSPEQAPIAPPAATPGPTFTAPGSPTQSYDPNALSAPTEHSDPDYNLPEPESESGGRRNLILGLAALIIIGGLVFLAVRAFSGGSSSGAASPEGAVQQLITSLNERDGVGFIEVFDPDEIEAWFGSFTPAIEEFEQIAEGQEASDELIEAYESVFNSFDYSLTGPGGEDPTYEVEMLDDEGRISRVRLDGIDLAFNVEDINSAIIVSVDSEAPTALDISEIDDVEIEVRDERRGLAATLFRPANPREDAFAENVHLDIVTVEKDGEWYVSIGYSVLEAIRTADGFPGFEQPDYGQAFRVVDDQTGGAESPEAAMQELFTAIESLDYDTIIQLTDPLATPYLHDYLPLINEQVDEQDRRDAARDINLNFDDIEFGVSEWNDRTLVTFPRISGRFDGGSFDLDTATWCGTIEDDFDSSRGCLEDGIDDALREIDSRQDPRDFIPEQTGMVVIERNGRWYLDPLGTMGFITEQIAEASVALSEELQTQLDDDGFSRIFIVEGPIARLGAPASRTALSGEVGVAIDVSDYQTIGERDTRGEFHVATALVRTTERADFINYPPLPASGEDWVVVYDRADSDSEIPAIGALTEGSLDVELFDVQVTAVGVDGFSGQLGGQGRPQIFTFSDEAQQFDITIEGAGFEDVYRWDSNGVVIPDDSLVFSSFAGGGEFTVVYGQPGAVFSINVLQPEPEPEPEPTSTPAPPPTPESFSPTFADPIADSFSGFVGNFGYEYVSEQAGGFFDGCGPDDPAANSYLFETDLRELVVISVYPSEDEATQAFADLSTVASPCDAFDLVIVQEVVQIDDTNVRIEWMLEDDPDSTTFEHYRLSGETVVVAVGADVAQVAEMLSFLDAW